MYLLLCLLVCPGVCALMPEPGKHHDGDQDIDLAVANEGQDEVYLNQNGVLDATPTWQSENAYTSNDLAWADMDNDNDLDLAVVHENEPVANDSPPRPRETGPSAWICHALHRPRGIAP